MINNQKSNGLTIYLKTSKYKTTQTLTTKYDITIIGQKNVYYTYNPSKSNNVINVNKGTLTIKCVTFTNSDTKKGHIFYVNKNAKLNMYNTNFNKITTTGPGSCIYNNQGNKM